MSKLRLYHTGYDVIEAPDIRIGRSNADFGQGFYLSDDQEFSKRWARERKGRSTYLNAYELDTADLKIKRFDRDAAWFDYIYRNRAGYPDTLIDYDVIIGPIANDTLYDTWGVITGGQLKREEALPLLQIGSVYMQIVIKSDKAAAALRFLGAEQITGTEIAAYRRTVGEEEQRFQKEFVSLLVSITGYQDEE